MTTAPEMAPAVAHILECYLGPTETFIHDTLCGFRHVRPVIIARSFANLDRFPPPPGAVLRRSPPRRGSPAWAISAIGRRLRGGDPHLAAILRRDRIRIMHAHFGPTACSLLEARRLTGIPLITSFYGYDASMHAVIEEFGDRYRRLFDLGDGFLVEGSAMRERLERMGCPSSRIRIQRIGIHPERYSFHERTPPDVGPIVILMCGRMVPKKGHLTGLEAFARVRARHPGIRLRIIGDGPLWGRIEERARSLGIADAVDRLGSCSRDRFLRELSEAHVLLQPSEVSPDGDTEGGAPTTLLEAQASGLPIVTTDHADIPEVVIAEQSALIAPEANAEALAAALDRLVSDPTVWAAMGRSGRGHVENEHDARRRSSELEFVYARLAETGRLEP